MNLLQDIWTPEALVEESSKSWKANDLSTLLNKIDYIDDTLGVYIYKNFSAPL